MSCRSGVCLFLLVTFIQQHCKGNECLWEVSENVNAALGSSSTYGISTLERCQYICNKQPGCVAVIYGAPTCNTFTSEPTLEPSLGWTYALKICTNDTLTTTSSTTTTTTRTTTRTTSPPAPTITRILQSGQTYTKSTTVSRSSTLKYYREDSASNESSGVPVAVIAGVVGAAVAVTIAVVIVVLVVIRNKRNKPPPPGHPAASNTENRGHRMATVMDNSNTTDRVTPASGHHGTDDRDPASTTENVYEITEESSHYYEPLSHRDNTYINNNTLYSNPVFKNVEEGGGKSKVSSASGGNTTYYNTGVQTNVNCNDNTTYRNMC